MKPFRTLSEKLDEVEDDYFVKTAGAGVKLVQGLQTIPWDKARWLRGGGGLKGLLPQFGIHGKLNKLWGGIAGSGKVDSAGIGRGSNLEKYFAETGFGKGGTKALISGKLPWQMRLGIGSAPYAMGGGLGWAGYNTPGLENKGSKWTAGILSASNAIPFWRRQMIQKQLTFPIKAVAGAGAVYGQELAQSLYGPESPVTSTLGSVENLMQGLVTTLQGKKGDPEAALEELNAMKDQVMADATLKTDPKKYKAILKHIDEATATMSILANPSKQQTISDLDKIEKLYNSQLSKIITLGEGISGVGESAGKAGEAIAGTAQSLENTAGVVGQDVKGITGKGLQSANRVDQVTASAAGLAAALQSGIGAAPAMGGVGGAIGGGLIGQQVARLATPKPVNFRSQKAREEAARKERQRLALFSLIGAGIGGGGGYYAGKHIPAEIERAKQEIMDQGLEDVNAPPAV